MMNIKFDVTINEFKEQVLANLDASKVVIWGGGTTANEFVKKLDVYNDFVKYYVDKSETKWNTQIGNVDVKSPECLFNDSTIDTVIIATMYFDNVINELKKNGFSGNVYSAFHMVNMDGRLDYKPLESHLEDVKAMLADEKSANIVEFIYEHRKNMDIDFSNIYESNQYFVQGIIEANPHAVFVDAGAYHGETIDEFISFQGGKFDKVYSFEMDTNNYLAIMEKKYDERVRILNYGLWDERTTCTYSSDNTGSAIGEGNLIAKCISLDEVIGEEEVTFIKMDIEGAEMKALYGAEKCIKRCKPQLAICVYHKPEDIYEITKLVHEWLPEHKLYIRHHSVTLTETVLYAVLK